MVVFAIMSTHPDGAIDLDTATPPPPPPSRRRGRIVAAAAAGALILSLMTATKVAGRGATPPDAAAALRAAAEAAERSAPDHGEARLVTIRQFELDVFPSEDGGTGVDRHDFLVRERIPADPEEPWHRRTRELAPDEGWAPDRGADTGVVINDWQGVCGDYFPTPGQDPCTRPGLWQDPTPVFLAGLPEEPAALVARLHADVVADGAELDAAGLEQESLLYAAAALESGIAARSRADIYRALATLPGLSMDPQPVVLRDGRNGTAVTLDARGDRVEIAVDTGSGEFLGWRRFLIAPRDGLPAGTVTAVTIVRVTTPRRGRRRTSPASRGCRRARRGHGPDAGDRC
ncbi:hypothetical protein Acsp01_26860 [Actinoplanes sp. NBRC 101535]|nr:hypothetical protein Acsp01_26860 [Actinoplanes sp. NBRC 101535]